MLLYSVKDSLKRRVDRGKHRFTMRRYMRELFFLINPFMDILFIEKFIF